MTFEVNVEDVQTSVKGFCELKEDALVHLSLSWGQNNSRALVLNFPDLKEEHNTQNQNLCRGNVRLCVD